MYNFNFIAGESLVSVFDDVMVSQNDNEKVISVAVTNKRIIFLDYVDDMLMDNLNGAHASSNIKIKQVIFSIKLSEIKEVRESDLYEIVLQDESIIRFNNLDLFNSLCK